MKKLTNRHLAMAASSLALSVMLGACSDQLEQPSSNFDNEYARAFIDRYGLPDPNHDWSMAKKAGLTVKSDKAVDLRIFAETDGQRYLFADLVSYSGNDSLPVIIPKSVDRLILEVNGTQTYVCGANDAVDLDALASAPRSRDYLDIDMEDPSDGKTHGEFTVGNIKSSSIDGRVLKYDIADNQALLEIIENPYSSQYLLYDEYVTDKGVHVKDPLMPSIEGICIGQSDKADHKLADYEFMPVYVRSDNSGNTSAEYEFKVNTRHGWVDGVKYHPNTTTLEFDNSTYNIGYIDGDGNTVNITNPTAANSTWVGKTFKVTANNQNIPEGLAYTIKTITDNTTSYYETGSFKSQIDTQLTWDTEVGGPTNAYSSCLYFDNVPFTYHDKDGLTKTENVFVYAIFAAPTETAQTRPDKADFFIVEFYDHDLLRHNTWFPIENRSYSYRMMAEDLGVTDDWDFNDLVVDISAVLTNRRNLIIGDGHAYFDNTVDQYADGWLKGQIVSGPVYHVAVTPRAAGGIMPIHLAYHGTIYTEPCDLSLIMGRKVSELKNTSIEDIWTIQRLNSKEKAYFQIGKEMHEWLGSNTTEKMINTIVIDHSGETMEFDAVAFSSSNFFALVDKDNVMETEHIEGTDYSRITNEEKCLTFNNLPGKYPNFTHPYQLIPQSMFLTTDFPWAKERVDFGSAYPEFNSWVADRTVGLGWYATRDRNLTVEE